MIRSEELDLREGLFYDAKVKGVDTGFWAMDTAAGLTADTVRDAIKVGDTGAAPASASSYSQYLFGDFEWAWLLDSTVPDSTDSERYFGLRNIGDTLQRGAIYFDLSYDTTAGDSSPNARPFEVVAYDEFGNKRSRVLTWDTNWSGGGRLARFRIKWEEAEVGFYINDTVVARLGGVDSESTSTFTPNAQIPQALRLSRRSTDTTDTNPTAFKYVNIRHARKVI